MERDDAYLLDMLLAARDAVEFAGGITFSQFRSSRLHQNAVLKAVEIVGEAASRISPAIRGMAKRDIRSGLGPAVSDRRLRRALEELRVRGLVISVGRGISARWKRATDGA